MSWAPTSRLKRAGPRRRRLGPPPRRYPPRSATPTLSPASLPLHSLYPVKCVRLGLSGLSPAPEALLRPGVPDAGQATGGPQGRRARIPPLRAAQGRASVGTELRAGSCDVPGANSDVASSTPALLSAAAARGTAGWGFGGAVQAPGPEVGAGPRREATRGRVGMGSQHLGRNSSRWFPPRVSEGSEMGACEPEGGPERSVCVRARPGGQSGLFLRPGKRS